MALLLLLLLLLLMRFEVEEDPVSLPRFFDVDFAALALVLTFLCAFVDDAAATKTPPLSLPPAYQFYFVSEDRLTRS